MYMQRSGMPQLEPPRRRCGTWPRTAYQAKLLLQTCESEKARQPRSRQKPLTE